MTFPQIEALRLPGLRNGEFSQFQLDFLAFVLAGDPTAMKVKAEYDALKAKSDQIESIFKTPQSSVITDEITNLDLRRDNALTGYSFIIRGFSYSIDANQKAAALLLTNHLAGYGKSITTDNLQSETASIRNIVNDVQTKTDLSNAIDVLNLKNWINEMLEANNLFGAAYRKRVEESGKTGGEEKLRDLRLETNQIYYELKDILNSYMIISKGAEPYATVIRNCSSLITYYNELLARRAGNGNEEENGGTTPTPPTT